MNKRIQELATEVGISVEYLTNTKQIVMLEKFAELVIKDTMQVVANRLPSNVYLDVAESVIEHYKIQE